MKIYLDTIGCRLNQSEIEKIGGQFLKAGHTLIDNASEADMVIINTCTVTKEAASDSRQKARQAYRSGAKNIVLTGCWATMDVKQAWSLPGITHVITNNEKDKLVPILLDIPRETTDLNPNIRQPLPGAHSRTRAFIKVQDGCDNHCTFCITRIARGTSHSQSISMVVEDVLAAQRGGVKEIVLTGVHLASWGHDFSPPLNLTNLISEIIERSTIPRIRLSSLEPWSLDEEFFGLWKTNRLCRHIHLPLQSGCASILKRMGRKNTPQSYTQIVKLARSVCPDIAITTDIIVSFPGEGDKEYCESLDFVEQTHFSGGHVFSFSARPGTPAVKLENLVTKKIRKYRSSQMRALFHDASINYRNTFVGKEVSVLWESCDSCSDNKWLLHGLSEHFIRVTAVSTKPVRNTINRVYLKKITTDGMAGKIID